LLGDAGAVCIKWIARTAMHIHTLHRPAGTPRDRWTLYLFILLGVALSAALMATLALVLTFLF
jgi:hypothetical protein